MVHPATGYSVVRSLSEAPNYAIIIANILRQGHSKQMLAQGRQTTNISKLEQHLEAFYIQLVILAIWKQAPDICHTQAASAIKGNPCQETATLNTTIKRQHDSPDIQECLETAKSPQDACIYQPAIEIAIHGLQFESLFFNFISLPIANRQSPADEAITSHYISSICHCKEEKHVIGFIPAIQASISSFRWNAGMVILVMKETM
ncbi:hypothetical protein L6452_05243 [Arctium lappa]|uniref:Uncharacterized protein n=1 Tax=Arctium lappa TaxID=4217 RepID=A0ACB9EGB6_ARCLA|nr:hypothetical protein L6452_05243 [Arctium lappa]